MWHSKAYDNFTAVMDIDEFIIVNGMRRPFDSYSHL